MIEWFPSSEAVGWLLWAADQAGDCKVVDQIEEYGDSSLSSADYPQLVDEAMFGDILDLTEPEDIAWVSRQLTGQPLRSFEETVDASKGAAAHLPRSYILCSDYFRSTWDGLEGDWSRSEALVGHDAMVIAPDRLAQAIADVL